MFIGKSKIAGILLESETLLSRAPLVVAGIGININSAPEDLSIPGESNGPEYTATSVAS